MRRRIALALALLALPAAGLGLAGCGGEEKDEVVEGEPLELGELKYNVVVTRFLNPDDVEDREYLAGLPAPPPQQSYLGVFMTIGNENDDEAIPSAHGYRISDNTHQTYEPVESPDNPYTLEVGATVPAEGELPLDDSTAASGPIEGALILFLVDDQVSENRPLELEIESVFGNGLVELDI